MSPTNCGKITNIQVGRAIDRQRIFVTCNQRGTDQTIVKFIDKGMKGQVIQYLNINTVQIEFTESSSFLQIARDTQPFIADLNGDYL